jgi:hypothetical protein
MHNLISSNSAIKKLEVMWLFQNWT